MRRRTKAKTKEITKTVLELLAVGSGVTFLTLFGRGRRSLKLADELASYGMARVRETLKRLRLQGYIQYDSSDEKTPIVLTDRGEARVLHFRLLSIPSLRKKWDYLWRMVIFDIPERQKHIRELFRQELKNAGFFPLQRSIFVTPYRCEKEMEDLCRCW